MDAIVAVYSDWGVGCCGTQPVTLSADRRRFRELTEGAAVIVGRKTLADFPGGRPLKNRVNIVLTRCGGEVEGAVTVHSAEEALAEAKKYTRAIVIGGASVYEQLLPYIDRVYVTKIDVCPHSDSFFPNLDFSAGWICAGRSEDMEENGLKYRFTVYERK